MQNLGFTVKKNLASTIRNYLKEKGRNVTEEDINEILQRIANINDNRPKGASIFLGGHRYFGGNNKDFSVKDGQQIDFSVSEYNEVFDGYLEKAKESPEKDPVGIKPEVFTQNKEHEIEQNLSNDMLKNTKYKALENSFSNMSDKQLSQIVNSNNLTTDIDQLEILYKELLARNNQEGAKKIEEIINMIKGSEQIHTEELLADNTEETIENIIPTAETPSEKPDNQKQARLPEIKINPSEKEIQNNIGQLKPGESYTYLSVKEEQNSWGYGPNQKNITWSRNEDNTLTKMTPDFQIDGDFGALTEKYTADGKQLLSRRKLGGIYLTKGLYTTTQYSNSKPINESTDLTGLSNITQSNLPHATRILELMTPEARIYKNDDTKNNAIVMDNQTFASKELKNSQKETVLTYKDGKFYNGENKKISIELATEIIQELIDTQDLSELIRNYHT